MLKALGYITRRVKSGSFLVRDVGFGRGLRDTRGARYILTLRMPPYIEERKQTWDERIRITSKKSDSGC